MGFSDRLRAWFKGESKRSAPTKSTDAASRSATKELEEFVRSRTGVEGFLEPKTAIYSTTLLLVADDGEYLRRPVKTREQAGEFCRRVNIPLYDAAKVGYPRRMREYEQGVRPRKVDLSELPPWPGDEPSAAEGPPPPPSERAEREPEATDQVDAETYRSGVEPDERLDDTPLEAGDEPLGVGEPRGSDEPLPAEEPRYEGDPRDQADQPAEDAPARPDHLPRRRPNDEDDRRRRGGA